MRDLKELQKSKEKSLLSIQMLLSLLSHVQCLKMYKGKKKSIREPIVEIEFISFRKN